VDGECVLRNGTPLNIDLQAATSDLEAATSDLEAAQKRSLEKVSGLDWAGRDADALAPMVLEETHLRNCYNAI
jgi:hypothetical protein